MEILPGKEQFISLSRASKRIPVCGQMNVAEFNPARIFKALFGDCEDAFLFESGKGPQATARFSILGKSNSRVLKFRHDNWETSQEGKAKQILPNIDDGFEKLNFSSGVQAVDYLPHFWGG